MTRNGTLSSSSTVSGVDCRFTRKTSTTPSRSLICNDFVAPACCSDLRSVLSITVPRRRSERQFFHMAATSTPQTLGQLIQSKAECFPDTVILRTSLCPLLLTLPAGRQRLECLDILLFIWLIKHQANLLHTSIEKRLHLIVTLLGIANNGHRIHHLIRHELCRSIALTRLVSVSDAIRCSAKTDTVKVLMVKYPHPTDIKRNVSPFTAARGRK